METFLCTIFIAFTAVNAAIEFMLLNMGRDEFIFFNYQFFINESHFTATLIAVPGWSIQQIILCENRKFAEKVFAGILFCLCAELRPLQLPADPGFPDLRILPPR